MTANPLQAALFLSAFLGAAACSKPFFGPAITVAGTSGRACLGLQPKVVAAILGASRVIVLPVANHAEACRFEGSNKGVLVLGLRSGEEVEPFWKLTVTKNNNRMVPLAGVGDRALRLPDGSEVLARKGVVSCQADVVGADLALARKSANASPDDLAQRLGELCNAVLARAGPGQEPLVRPG